MYKEIVAAGFGGQGSLTTGEFLVMAAIKEGLDATWVPTYGQEKRGGDANASVIISSDEVISPIIETPDALLSMNDKSIINWGNKVKKEGAIFYNSSLVSDEDVTSINTDIETYPVPCFEIAKKIGNEKVANIVLLGAYLAYDKVVGMDTMVEVIEDKMKNRKSEIIDQNIKAIESGAEYYRNLIK